MGLVAVSSAAVEPTADHRAWQHGIDLLRVGDRLLVVWGSAGNPPRPNLGGDWTHDVYYAWLNPPLTQDFTPIEPQILVSRPEAQEPPSIALNSSGILLMSTEDGEGDINQYAGMWDSALRVLKKYPFVIKRGGHSGHVAAMGERFLVVYGEGWVEGGGFLDLGTGKDIYARIVEGDGKRHREVRISSGHRDGWPLVAGSDHNWLVVWQRYPELSLHMALINARGDMGVQRQISDGMPLRYAYDVEYSSRLALYVVAGTSAKGGFVSLVSRNGDIIRTRHGLPPMVSESRIVLGHSGPDLIGVYPVSPRGVAVVRFTTDAIELVKFIDHSHAWDYSGTSGAFVAPDQVLFVTLSTTGLHLIPINLRD